MRTTIVASLLFSAAGCVPARALAQAQDADRDETSLAAWTLLGLDLDVTERWRGVVRVGYLADVDSRLILGDVIFTATPALQVVAGYVAVQPTANDARGISLTRAGAIWLPLRRRVTVDTRFLVERRSGDRNSTSIRGRSRFRVSSALPGPLLPRVFGTVEDVASTDTGRVETRIQLGATKPIGRWSFELHWLQRRVRDRPVVNGLGATAFCRIGGSHE